MPRDEVSDHDEVFNVEKKMFTAEPCCAVAGAERVPEASARSAMAMDAG